MCTTTSNPLHFPTDVDLYVKVFFRRTTYLSLCLSTYHSYTIFVLSFHYHLRSTTYVSTNDSIGKV